MSASQCAAETRPHFDPSVGQCSVCEHASVQTSARGNRFWRCRRADLDARLLRYPPLPVASCPGYDARTGDDAALGSSDG